MDKKNNTAIICLSPYSGGMEIDSIKLAKKLSSYTNITLIAKAKHFIANQKDEYVGLNDIELETIAFSTNLSFSIIFGVRKIIRAKNIKNVIFFGASELKSLYFAFLGFDINLIVRHGTTKSRPKKDWFHRLIYSKVNYHVSICKHLQKNVEYIIPFGEDSKSVIIYPSLEIKEIKKVEHEKLALVHVGRVARGKGQLDAVLACEVLVKNNIDFVLYIVGGFDEKYQDEFMKLYHSLEYKDKIKLVGFTKDVDSYLAKSDIFLFPSYGEGLSNAFLEALRNNLMCISYNNTSFPELQELGFEFEMAKDRDKEDLKQKLFHTVQSMLDGQIIENHEKINSIFSEQREIFEYMEKLV
jgi:glycosyltransferase involved in cell wall biosynthesis